MKAYYYISIFVAMLLMSCNPDNSTPNFDEYTINGSINNKTGGEGENICLCMGYFTNNSKTVIFGEKLKTSNFFTEFEYTFKGKFERMPLNNGFSYAHVVAMNKDYYSNGSIHYDDLETHSAIRGFSTNLVIVYVDKYTNAVKKYFPEPMLGYNLYRVWKLWTGNIYVQKVDGKLKHVNLTVK